MFYIVLCSCCCLPYIFLSFHSTLMSSIQSLAHLFLLQNVSSSGSLSCVFNRLWGRWTTTTTTTIRQTRSLTSLLHSDYCASTKKTDEGKLWLLTLKHWRISFVTRFTSLIIQEKNSCNWYKPIKKAFDWSQDKKWETRTLSFVTQCLSRNTWITHKTMID